MIYDCFTFFNELEILDIRLEELDPVVDGFIIVESNFTFSGKPKHSYFYENVDRYEKYLDKIKIVTVPGVLNVNSWQREYDQRNGIGWGLQNKSNVSGAWFEPEDNDTLLISDADEIPRRSVIENLDLSLDVQAIALQAYYYGLNVKSQDIHTIRAVKKQAFHELGGAQKVRMLTPEDMKITHDGGWHFSYLGPVEHIIQKFQSFAHTELDRYDTTNPEILLARMASGGDLWGDGHQYEFVEVDDTWPEAVKRDKEHWSKYIWQK